MFYHNLSDLPTVSTKSASFNGHAVRLEHHCYNASFGMFHDHDDVMRNLYVCPIDIVHGAGYLKGYLYLYFYNGDPKMEVEMEVDYLENGKMKWNLRKSFTTDTIRNLTPERAKHEGLGYFLIKLNAHQFFKRVDMENPAEMKENITKWFERKKVAFKDFVDDYLK